MTVNPASLTFTTANWNIPQAVTITAVNDHVPEGGHAGTILHTAASTDAVYNGAPISSLSVTINDLPADDWRFGKFTPAELANPAISGDAADPNNNGIPNLLEYALNGDPKGSITGTSILPSASRNAVGNCLQVNFSRYLDRNDITLIVQASDTIGGTWTDLAVSINGSPFAVATGGVVISEVGTGNARTVTVSDIYQFTDSAHPRRFMRLKVTRP